jgi:hypothetical protein
MKFPGVSEDGIFVDEVNNQIVGFAIVSFLQGKWGNVGTVLELQCLDSSSFSNLIQTIINYCASKNADAIILHPPPLTHISSVLQGWHKTKNDVMLVKPISLSPLLEKLLLQENIRKISQGKTIIFYIGNEAIKVTDEKIQTINANDIAKDGVTIFISPQILLGILFNQLNPLFCWLKRKIKIKGITNIPLAIKLLNELKLNGLVYISPADKI